MDWREAIKWMNEQEREEWQCHCEHESLHYCQTMLSAHFDNLIYDINKALRDTMRRIDWTRVLVYLGLLAVSLGILVLFGWLLSIALSGAFGV